MVISDAEKKILLERLQKAREVKAAKAAAAKKTPVPKKEAIPAPIIEPTPVPEVLKDAVKDLPPLEPPNLLAMVAKVDDEMIALPPKMKRGEKGEKGEKGERNENSSDESDDEKPVKKSSKISKKAKQAPYMKIKIFHEPKNAHALQNLIEAVQDYDDEPAEYVREPVQVTSVEAPRLRHDIKNQTPKSSRTLPSHQELMRKAAMEFFG